MGQNKPKLIFYIESNELGGCEKTTLSRVIGIERLGIPTGIICSKRLELGAYQDAVSKLTLGCIKLPLKCRSEYPLSVFLPSLDFRQKNMVQEVLAQIRPDLFIVAQSGPETCHSAMLAAASLGIPIVAYVALLVDQKTYPYKGRFLRYLWIKKHYRLCKRIITNCRKNVEILRGLVSEKTPVDLVYNGIKSAEFPPCPSLGERQAARREMGILGDDWLIGIVGRLTVEKGHEWLISAFKELLNIMPDAKLVIIGDGELYSKLKSKALILKDHVKFMGWREDVSQLYWGFDVLVQPSLMESNPSTVLQAFSSRIPVIATNVHGIPDIIRDNENGLLIEPFNIRSFNKAMCDIRNDERKRGEIINSAFKYVTKEADFNKQLNKFLECILQL